jgi:hypothetical protein
MWFLEVIKSEGGVFASVRDWFFPNHKRVRKTRSYADAKGELVGRDHFLRGGAADRRRENFFPELVVCVLLHLVTPILIRVSCLNRWDRRARASSLACSG